jgi:hypothetical protein
MEKTFEEKVSVIMGNHEENGNQGSKPPFDKKDSKSLVFFDRVLSAVALLIISYLALTIIGTIGEFKIMRVPLAIALTKTTMLHPIYIAFFAFLVFVFQHYVIKNAFFKFKVYFIASVLVLFIANYLAINNNKYMGVNIEVIEQNIYSDIREYGKPHSNYTGVTEFTSDTNGVVRYDFASDILYLKRTAMENGQLSIVPDKEALEEMLVQNLTPLKEEKLRTRKLYY